MKRPLNDFTGFETCGSFGIVLSCSLVYLHCFHLEFFVFFFVRGSNGSDDVVLYKTMAWSIARFSAFA